MRETVRRRISQMRAAMLIAVTLVSPDVAASEDGARRIDAAMAKLGAPVKRTTALGPGAIDLIVEADTPPDIHLAVRSALGEAPVDLCVQPWEGRRKRLLVADMDSTIIGCECLDELADFAGVKAEVSAITERAMRGEIGFEGALRERVAMLKGLPLTALERCYAERVRLNPGARTLVKTMAAHGARCMLVSGGFSFFAARVAEAAGFHAERANTLLDDGAGALSGQVGEPILGREAKLAALRRKCRRRAWGIDAARGPWPSATAPTIWP